MYGLIRRFDTPLAGITAYPSSVNFYAVPRIPADPATRLPRANFGSAGSLSLGRTPLLHPSFSPFGCPPTTAVRSAVQHTAPPAAARRTSRWQKRDGWGLAVEREGRSILSTFPSEPVSARFIYKACLYRAPPRHTAHESSTSLRESAGKTLPITKILSYIRDEFHESVKPIRCQPPMYTSLILCSDVLQDLSTLPSPVSFRVLPPRRSIPGTLRPGVI